MSYYLSNLVGGAACHVDCPQAILWERKQPESCKAMATSKDQPESTTVLPVCFVRQPATFCVLHAYIMCFCLSLLAPSMGCSCQKSIGAVHPTPVIHEGRAGHATRVQKLESLIPRCSPHIVLSTKFVPPWLETRSKLSSLIFDVCSDFLR